LKKAIIASLKIIIPLGVGIYLTWFFISNLTDIELENLKNAFLEADYLYIFYGVIIMTLSHLSRAYRWKYMLEPLGHQPKFWKMFHGVMIGYLINLTIPRSGEVARAGYYAKFEKKAKFEKIFGTIVVERIIDVVMLAIVLGITLVLQKDIDAFNAFRDVDKPESNTPLWVYFVIASVIILGIIIIFRSKKLKDKVINLFKGVLEGVKTIFKLKQRVGYIAHTLFIWACYISILWVFSFALPETANLNINAVFAAFVVGAVAISATPGGIGLYPIMVSAVLTNLYNIENAESFSILAWSTLTLFTIIVGLISLFALPFISKKED
jgi:uncharacterized protein (TIRG00374 family)